MRGASDAAVALLNDRPHAMEGCEALLYACALATFPCATKSRKHASASAASSPWPDASTAASISSCYRILEGEERGISIFECVLARLDFSKRTHAFEPAIGQRGLQK